jgi:uncharacterized protein YqeY
MTLRSELSESLKTAMKARQEREVATLRMVLAGLKDRDIDARGKGRTDGIPEDEILQMMQNMIRQRRDSIALYEQGGRPELAAQETAEIAIIERFLPKQLDEAAIEAAAKAIIAELGAASVKDMGKVMAAMKTRHAGQMDFSKASAAVKKLLG